MENTCVKSTCLYILWGEGFCFSNFLTQFLNFVFVDPTFFPGRCAQVIVKGNPVGVMGVIHPDVIDKFDLNLPCAALELNVEAFL